MDDIKLTDLAQYDYNKKKQILGILCGTLVPISMVVGEFLQANDEGLPQILDHEQATKICLQESFENTSLSDDGFHINLSKPEINACAASKITQSEQTHAAYIEEREDHAWKPYALAGAFAAAFLSLAGGASLSNKRLRKEHPGIEKLKYTRNIGSLTPDP